MYFSRLFFLLILICSFNVSAVKVEQSVLSAYAKHSQFIDIKISPSGDYIASTSRNDEGVISLTVLDLNKNEIISVTRGKGNESVSTFTWLNEERLLLTMAREVGSFELPRPTGELIAMDANGKRKVILTGPRSKTGDIRFSSIIDILPTEPDQVLIYSVEWTASEPYLDLYRMKVTTGRKRSLGRVPMRVYKGSGVAVYTNKTGEPLAAQGIDPNRGNKAVLMARLSVDDDWKVILETNQYEGSFTPLKFIDNETLIGLSDLETDTQSIATLNIRTKKHTVLASHNEADLTPVFSVKTGQADEIVAGAYEYDEVGIVFLDDVDDPANQALIKSLMGTFKNQNVRVTSSTYDNKTMILSVSSANTPQKFYVYDNEKRKLSVLTASKPWLKSSLVPKTQIITYKNRDGDLLTGLLTLPKDKSTNLPLILLPHGGPHGVQDSIANLNSDVKVLSSHGYAVFQPNYRGSGGYGRSFLTSGFKNWGTSMIDDMTDGTRTLIKQGIVDKTRMCVYGGSYGGYAALQSVIREPELYKCTIGFVGVYDLDLMYTEGDIKENESGTNYLDTVLPTGNARIAQSPVHNVDKIKVPVFIIQGEEDVRVPKEHAFKLRDELKKRNMPFEWMMKSGEGHGFYKPENNIERWTEMLDFLDKHIGK
ncbi:peptidase [Pseudoalteromonas carrageenovora]|uniref:Acylaminoacyl-peptidase n=1 Tax=Pseudoalteromonas carrageenovora IAM 12662 TaxID=1314868 RepID=A0A2K4X8S2_PSEVC|nr:acylaminoacyl-peptidase [Pseudoalteromonas carrageenovora IAM 12662]QBJ71635.1 peptidase [Pseudoalteromonas carrageenovora]GEB70222.1 peptidase S9 [Pseudoalteromonas carrageenovora]SOU40726.1 Peptidase S9 [Pseudoalteromonas carrageenovora IAM 12662]